jgi:hypothetical protein
VRLSWAWLLERVFAIATPRQRHQWFARTGCQYQRRLGGECHRGRSQIQGQGLQRASTPAARAVAC